MKKIFQRFFYVAILGLIITSCTKKENYQIEIDNNVKNINSIDDQKKFLLNIYDDGQGIDLKIKTLEKSFFKNRKEITLLRKKRDSLIFINRYRIDSYLKKYSYPKKNDFSDDEKQAIYYGVYYDIQKKEQLKYFDLFEKLYKENHLTEYQYLNYLTKIYYLKHTSFFPFNKRHTIKEMIEDISPEIIKIKENIE